MKTFTQGVSFEGYTFVNFGAPWCSHCQKLAPIWDRLAQKFANIEEIRIARVDCTASESICRDYGVRIPFSEKLLNLFSFSIRFVHFPVSFSFVMVNPKWNTMVFEILILSIIFLLVKWKFLVMIIY